MNYHHLTIEERACIFQFKEMGMKIREVAHALKRTPSTISRELKRNSYKGVKPYHPTNAQCQYEIRRKKCHRPKKITNEIKIYIEDKLQLRWSPEQISKRELGRIEGCPSFSTIYRWIHERMILKGDMTQLRRKGKFKRPQETRGRFNIGKTIKKRPKEVHKRKVVGHWEADTVESGRFDHKRKSKYCFVTVLERKSRIYLAKLIPDRTQENVTRAIIEILSQYPKEQVKTITCDRGKEFSGYKEIESVLKCDVYFTDPYCAWQKGSNENGNGLLREFYPKGMDLSLTTNNELSIVLSLMNNRPRKCLGYKTPLEVMNDF